MVGKYRNCALQAFEDNSSLLTKPSSASFHHVVREVFKPVPSLVLLVALNHSLHDAFPFDSITVKTAGNVIDWIARDSSKPDRKRKDGKECWVIQSTADYAQAVIK